MERIIPSSKQKALRINLDPDIYGNFAEIGAGQESVRHFFRAGGASGTIAKAMSAYDKAFSDAVYGPEEKNRYVCKPRLLKMLEYEYDLMEERLDRKDHPTKKYFAFANTVATIDYKKRYKGHGWVGIRFQTDCDKEPNDVILHIKPLENDARLQQETIGLLGVNLIYAAYFYNNDPDVFLDSLYDHLERDQLEIDSINFTGPDFEYIDNRLMSLKLVRKQMTQAVIFSPDGRNLQPSDLLYKKNILAIRGSFRPVTKVNIDMILNGYDAFVKDEKVDKDKMQVLFEITLNNLRSDGEVNEKDFLDRADILCSLGQTVMISNYKKYYKLCEYLSSFTKERMGFIMGVDHLQEVFTEKYYHNLNGGLLEAFGILFTRDVKIYLYPFKNGDGIINSQNVEIHPRLSPLYDYLAFNKRIIDLEGYNPDVLGIFSKKVLEMIRSGEKGWEEMVPSYVDVIIKKNRLFGYKGELVDNES